MTPDGLGFLLGEMAGLLVAAGVVGLLSGWLIFGGRSGSDNPRTRWLGADDVILAQAKEKHRAQSRRIQMLETELAEARAAARGEARAEVAAPEPAFRYAPSLRRAADDTPDAQKNAQKPALDAKSPTHHDALDAENPKEMIDGSDGAVDQAADGTADQEKTQDEGATEQPAEPVVADTAQPPIPRVSEPRRDREDREDALAIEPGKPVPDETEAASRATERRDGGTPYGPYPRDGDHGRSGLAESMPMGRKPPMRVAPRAGGPDPLQQIRGIGPKIEALCHDMGLFHFEQIAAWDEKECAWMDANLTGYTGQVTRDHWVAQARALLDAQKAARR
ncbi:hypothetical protein [Cognatishimia sp. F0-27]|uniref:hypothetical protein n=1 Tax=Cognatishimia sp. F0-27 TaxID=2816855 RepID=UPI001D0C2A25|nr:hypothetical protein [Cognatishimia sp. F0-27]MCC1493178.1 hypothetical protein [Cognatishimia sp. F0-27]